jgi:restriction endonuclease S subunit
MVTGSNYPALSVGDVKDLKIPLPPLAEQRKIAEILRTWDEAIETAEAELKAKQELLKRAVAKYFEKTYRDASSGKVGELKTLDAVCTRKGEYGAAVSACPYNPEWPRYIRITDITETGILKKERAVSISPESAEGYGLKMGDLLFARTGEPGRCLIFNEAYAAAFAGYLIRFKARPEVILSEYVYFYTLSSVYYKWVGDVSQKGAQANINAKVYGSLQLPVIDLTSQEAAVRVFKSLQESVLLAEQGAELLRAQKRGLMQKLLTGEVRVAA